MRAGGGRGRWRGWDDAGDAGRPPRRRPPWWPEGEPFPPAWRQGRRGRPYFIRWIGCLFLFTLVLAALGGGLVGVFVGRLGFLPVVVVGVLFILMVGLAATGGMRRMTRPMDNLIDAARRIEGGDFSAQVPESGPPELRSMARAFNSMSARLKSVDEQRRGFLADVTHELRTPLSVIRGQAEGIADGLYPADAAHIAPILDATQTMDRLVEDLRTLALNDAGSLELRKEPTDLGELARDTAESFEPEAAAAGVALTTNVAADLPTVDVDPARVRQVIGNLLSNAINHTPRGGGVNVGVGSAIGEVTITVADTGEGIPPDLLPHVFERFAKGPGSQGSGLGLAIAHAIVTAHGGELQVSNGVEGGTVLRVILRPAPPR